MRTIEEVNRALALVTAGYNDCEIARRTGISRATIRTWRLGRVPGAVRRANAGQSCARCGHQLHDPAKLPRADYAYLLGMYLGDGCISSMPKQVFSLRIVLDRKYPGIVSECATAMAAVMPESSVSVLSHPRDNVEQVASYSRAWPCLFPQHGPGMKHHRRIQLVDWQTEITRLHPKELLRGLIHSDGCRGLNTIKHPKKTYAYPRYQFSNRSDDIRQIFCDHLDLLGIDWRVMNRWNISVARRDAVARMDEFIGPKR